MIESGMPFDLSKPVEMAKFDTSTLIQANRMRRLSKQEAKQRALQLLTDHPDSSPTEIAVKIGRTRQTVYDYLKELEAEGRISKNGTGQIVVVG